MQLLHQAAAQSEQRMNTPEPLSQFPHSESQSPAMAPRLWSRMQRPSIVSGCSPTVPSALVCMHGDCQGPKFAVDKAKLAQRDAS